MNVWCQFSTLPEHFLAVQPTPAGTNNYNMILNQWPSRVFVIFATVVDFAPNFTAMDPF